MVDMEGPCNPADKQGNQYIMTYICCVCRGLLTARAPKCNAAHARRMLAECMMRSGKIPSLLRSDRGPELKNMLMQEYTALVDLGRRFGTPWRPMEQGLVEGVHLETQKIMGSKGVGSPKWVLGNPNSTQSANDPRPESTRGRLNGFQSSARAEKLVL